jgi:putative sigma-54 modulation protein
MHIHLSPRHMPLTAAIHQSVATHLSQLEELGTEIIAAHVVLLHAEAKDPGDRYEVRVHLAVAGPDIFASDSENDLYIALERVTAKLARQLRKRKTARTDKARTTTQRAVETQRKTGALPKTVAKGLNAKGGGKASSSGRPSSGRVH